MIAELEDAIIERINAAQRAKIWPYTIPTVESYGGQIDEDTQSTFRFPAVFVAFIGSKRKQMSGERGRIITVRMNLYIAARNPRNERATRHGDLHEPGSFQMAEDMIALLENQKLGMPMTTPLAHTEIQTIFAARRSDGATAESVLCVHFECDFGWQAALPITHEQVGVTDEDWLSTGQTFYLSPGDDVPDLAADIIHAKK